MKNNIIKYDYGIGIILFIVISLIGFITGDFLNSKTVSFLYENYHYSENFNSILGLIVNTSVIVIFYYLFARFILSKQKK